MMLTFLSIVVALAAIGVGILIYKVQQESERPDLDLQRWWGVGAKPKDEDTSVRSFKIDFNDSMIEDLKLRVKNRRSLTKPLEGTQSEYGMNTDYLEKILNYWTEKYDFKERAKLLNRFPHYKTRIQGLDIHFIRVKPDVKGVKVLPLLMLHGWPSSSKEFDKVIPILTTKQEGYDFVFEVVAADLPGFGFSEGTKKQGLNAVQIGIVMRNLMKRLGYDKYYLQAGDWGSHCASHLATLFPNEVLGYHTNMPSSSRPITNLKILFGSLFPTFAAPKYTSRMYPLKDLFAQLMREGGYFHLQATKPDTVGVGLTDSPTGLAAYLMEKMAICSNRDQLDTPHGGLENLNLDDVLDTVTIVWANDCIVTSMRIYAEALAKKYKETAIVYNIKTPVPTAALNFRYEIFYQPDWMLRDKYPNLVRSTTVEYGGHFAALQTPKEFADDVFQAAVAFMAFHEENKK